MKTYLTYGFIMTLAGAFVNLGLHFSGFYADPEKLKMAQNIGIITGLAITITGVLLGMRDKRAGTPADKPWGYGSALGTGVMIGLFSCILSAFYNYAYFAFINPDFTEIVVEAQLAAMEAKNIPAAHIDGAEPMIRKFSSPGVMTVMGMIMGFLWTVVISLVVAAFVKNRPAGTAVAA
ncbi:MAG: hypothetical protein RLZZ129_2695 [Verrucomicrobiota bacterium]|jgi:hypothetical protein